MPGKICPNCGSSIEDDVMYCPVCGKSTVASSAPPPQQPNTGYAPPPVYNNAQYPQSNYQYVQPNLDAPMTMGQYIVTFIITAIPIVGIIMLFVWAFGSNVNINKKNYSRAALIMAVIGIVLGIIFSSVLASMIVSMFGHSGYSYY